MTGASISFTSRACVLCFGSSSIDREPLAIRTCARLRWRAHSGITPGPQQARNPASHQSGAISSRAGRLLTTRIERTQTRALLVVSVFSLGQRLICNLRGGFKALRCLLPSNPLVPVSPKTTCGIVQTFSLSPIRLPSLLTAHESNVAKGSCHERQVTCKG